MVFLVPGVGFLLDEVHQTHEILFAANRQLQHYCFSTEFLLDLVDHCVEVGTHAIHFVDVADAGHIVLVGLFPYGLGLGFHASHRAKNGDGSIQYSQRTFYFDGEINMSRCVDDVDLVVLVFVVPVDGGGGAGDGNTTLLLLHHPVHGGCALVYFTNLVAFTGVIKNAFCRGGLTGVNMRHNPDIPDFR